MRAAFALTLIMFACATESDDDVVVIEQELPRVCYCDGAEAGGTMCCSLSFPPFFECHDSYQCTEALTATSEH